MLQINAEHQARSKNIVPCHFGLSDEDKTLYFLAASLNVGGSHIIDESENTGEHKKITIPVKKGDGLVMLSNETIGLIKIDVEGHELHALRGCENLIIKNKPFILFEQGVTELSNGTSPVVNYLKQLGYSFAVLERNFQLWRALFAKGSIVFIS